MKSFFLLLLTCVLLTFSATAQTAVAKIKYEEAEEAFTQSEYATTLTRLDEAEKILGATNPRILYLRIMAADKVVQADPYTNFALLQRLRQQCALYLTKYDNLENNEDKYRDVYKVSESLKQLPASQAAADAHAKDVRAKQKMMENAKATPATELARSQEYVNSLIDKYKFKAGLSIEQFRAYNPAAAVLTSRYESGMVTYNRKGFAKRLRNDTAVLGPDDVWLNAQEKVSQYKYIFLVGTTPEVPAQAVHEMVAEIRGNVAGQYIKNTGREPGNEAINIVVPGTGAGIAIYVYKSCAYISFWAPE